MLDFVSTISERLLLAGARVDVENRGHKTPAKMAAQPGGGDSTRKDETYALIQGWDRAVRGRPVLVRVGLAETESVYIGHRVEANDGGCLLQGPNPRRSELPVPHPAR